LTLHGRGTTTFGYAAGARFGAKIPIFSVLGIHGNMCVLLGDALITEFNVAGLVSATYLCKYASDEFRFRYWLTTRPLRVKVS
jgi:hypothetical protein